MCKAYLSLAAAVAIMGTSAVAHAFTLTNCDRTEHTFGILVADDEWTVRIQAGETLRDLCRSGCTISLGLQDEQSFEGSETVTIVNGRLLLGEEAKGAVDAPARPDVTGH